MPKPNFFIVGAPKCGTTALCEYLKDHPNVFMSTPKEPHYFAEDFEKYRRVKTEEDYLSLFSGCNDQHLAIGEASVFYLRSASAVSLVRNFNPDAKIIVMLRNPVDMIYSLHAQLRMSGDETVKDFERAWYLQEERAKSLSIPSSCREPAFLQYREMGMLGKQLEELMKVFPTDQVKVILFDDFDESPRAVYVAVLDFIGVVDDKRSDFQQVNSSRKHRVAFAGRLLRNIPQGVVNIAMKFKNTLGIDKLNILGRLRALNSKTQARPPMSEELSKEIRSEFASDIKTLEKLVGASLDHWIGD